jgi:integrase
VLAYELAYIRRIFAMYLKKIGRVFYFYCRVPKDLVGMLNCKELKKSLKTTDRRTARTAAKSYALELERLGVYARTGIMDDMQLHRALERFKHSFLLGLEGARDLGASLTDVIDHQVFSTKPIDGIDFNAGYTHLLDLFGDGNSYPDPDKALNRYVRLLGFAAEELRTGNFSDETRRAARRLVSENGIDLELPPDGWFDENDDLWFAPLSGDFMKVIRRYLQTRIDCFKVEIERLRGNYSNPYDTQARNKRPPFFLSEAIDKFCEHRQNESPANEETQRRYRNHFNVMLEMLGDRDVTEFTRQDLLRLKELLYQRTANLKKKPTKNIRTLDKRTVETNYVGKIASLFRWLHINDYVDRDLSPGLVKSLTAAEKKARKRKEYGNDELKIIFDLLPFDRTQPHLAWVPLIAAYSGARQGEICQLLVTDIKEENDIPYMRITEEDEDGNIVKTVKNENSKRLVPLHPVIVEMGFLKFVELRKAQGKRVIFETRSHRPLTGQYYSKRFQEFNRKQITNDPKKVFHSFRHLVHNELKQKKVPADIYHSITGHVPQHEMDAVYADDHILTNKYEALQLLEYPNIDLVNLREKFNVFLQ